MSDGGQESRAVNGRTGSAGARRTQHKSSSAASGGGSGPKAGPRDGRDEEEATVAGVRITHPDRPLFPESELTKLDLARYFEAAWPLLEPYVTGRPLAFVRCPEGARAACFFQKHWPDEIDGVEPVDISEPGERDQGHQEGQSGQPRGRHGDHLEGVAVEVQVSGHGSEH